MGLKIKVGEGQKKERAPIPKGVHKAVCTAIYDLGTQQSVYMGETKKKHEINMQFELPTVRTQIETEEGTKDVPGYISIWETFSLAPKSNLRPLLEGWRGEEFQEGAEFDLTAFLGASCLVQVMHKTKSDGTIKDYIKSIMPATEDVEPEGDLKLYELGGEVPDGMPAYFIGKVNESLEVQSGKVPAIQLQEQQPQPVGAGEGDGIPF